MKLKKRLCILTAIGLILALHSSGYAIERSGELSPESLSRLKDLYDFKNWGSETGMVISGVEISEKILPQLTDMKQVWQHHEYSVRRLQSISFAQIRQWWRSENSRLFITMIVGPSFEAAKEYLISEYAVTSMVPPPIRPRGRQHGLQIGHICFTMAGEKGNGGFSAVDFIRHNVIFLMRAEGDVQTDLRAMAELLDALLREKAIVENYAEHPDLPRITAFSPEKAEIRLGEKVLLNLEMYDSEQRKLHYEWKVTGGGVEKNLQDRFEYYGGEEGAQHITVTVVNELGLIESASTDIVVVGP